MTDNAGEQHVVGGFEPVGAYITMLERLVALVEAVQAAPDAIPPREVLRAAQVAQDTLEAITEVAVTGLLERLASVIPLAIWTDHNLQDSAEKDGRSESEAYAHKWDLISRAAPLIPIQIGNADV